MIVIPQIINYRLIIGSLVIAIIVLGSYSFVNYNTLKEEAEFLQQEQKLMETELSQMLRLYNDLEATNNNLNTQLSESRTQAQEVLDSLRLIQANEPLINKYKTQIQQLRMESFQLKQKLDNYTLDNTQQLSSEKDSEEIVSSNKVSSTSSKNSELILTSLEARALMLFRSGKTAETNRAKRVSQLEVCFSLSNAINPEDLFIQVLSPKNIVIADKGEVNFGSSSLIYSKKVSVNKSNSKNLICETIESDEADRFTKGTYFINLFNNQKLLANTTLELD